MIYSWEMRAHRYYFARPEATTVDPAPAGNQATPDETYPDAAELRAAYRNLIMQWGNENPNGATHHDRMMWGLAGIFDPSPYITDRDELAKELARRSCAMKDGSMGISAEINWYSFRCYADAGLKMLERGKIVDDTTPGLETLCRLLNVRYPFLPYEGRPHRKGAALWRDIQDRAATYGITREEFSDCLGISYDDLRRAVLSQGPNWPRPLCETLSQKLHVRAWPEPSGIVAQDASDREAEREYLSHLWRMGGAKLAKLMDASTGTGIRGSSGGMKMSGLRSQPLDPVETGFADDGLQSLGNTGEPTMGGWKPWLSSTGLVAVAPESGALLLDDSAGVPMLDMETTLGAVDILGVPGLGMMPPVRGVM